MRDRLSSLQSLRSVPGTNGELDEGEYEESSRPASFSQTSPAPFRQMRPASFHQTSTTPFRRTSHTPFSQTRSASFSQTSPASFSQPSHTPFSQTRSASFSQTGHPPFSQTSPTPFSQTSLEEEEEGQGEEPSDVGGGSGEVEAVLQEALEARREIQQLRLDVRRLREQNCRIISEPHASQELRRDSNAIGADIKERGQGTLTRLRKMDAHARELEEKHGVNSAVARIARTQYVCLSNSLRDAMMDYNEAEMSHRETCKAHIQRQMEIVGQEVSGDEVEEMLEGGQWNVFAQNLQSEGKAARSALGQIEKRHQELLELESRIRSIHEVFLDVAMLVEEQGPMLNSIQVAVEKTEIATGDALVKIQTAKKHDRNNPLKKLFFWRR